MVVISRENVAGLRRLMMVCVLLWLKWLSSVTWFHGLVRIENRRRSMYQPKLRSDQVKALYQLKLIRKRPMTFLLQEAVDAYFLAHGGTRAVRDRCE